MKRYLPGVLLLAALSGCATGSGRLGRVAEEAVVFPTPPDTARVQFLFALSSEADVKGRAGGFFSSFLNESASGPVIEKPYGVSYYDGRFYVCDSMLPGVEIIDLRAQTFERWLPVGEGRLQKPINCFVDSADGRLYVADTDRRQVVVFDAQRKYLGAFAEGPSSPVDVVVENDRVWVTGLGRYGVRAFDRDSWELLASFPEADGEVEVPLRSPTNLAVRDGEVFVSDFGNFDVKIYDTEGRYRRTVGAYGRGLGQFSRPKGLDVDPSGRMYVVDAGFQNVQVFDAQGALLMYFGGAYAGPGTLWLPAKVRLIYDDLELFKPYVDERFELEYVIAVTNQYGPDKLTVFGFVRPRATDR